MAARKKPNGQEKQSNGLSAEKCEGYFARIDEVVAEARIKAAEARGDVNIIYDEMVNDLDCTKEAAKLLWARRDSERRFANRAKKLEPADRRSLEMFSTAMGATPMGDWAGAMASGMPEQLAAAQE